jgi:hypothetical protein
MTTSERFWPTPNTPNGGRGIPKDTERVGGTLYSKGRKVQWMLHHAVLTSSPAASPAPHSPSLESEKARETTAISGLNCIDLWFPSGPVGAFLNRCLGSLAWWPALTGYSLTWVRAATPQGRSLFRLRLSAPSTAATGSGSLPTMFQSPMPSDVDGGRTTKGKHRQNETGIRKQAMWPTPSANEMRTMDAEQLLERRAACKEKHGNNGFGLTLGNAIILSEPATGMKLSAAWVSRLMGYPDGWLNLD